MNIEDLDGGCFDEVEVYGSGESMEDFMSGYNSSGVFLPTDDGSNIGGGDGLNGNEGGGNGDDQTICNPGFVKDANGICVKKPCIGDPILNPEIAKQNGPSGIAGGMFDTCTRLNIKRICKGVKGIKSHNGVDLKNPKGAPIYAIYGGKIVYNFQKGGAGHYISISSIINGKNIRMVYFHLQLKGIKSGNINAGDIIGYQGDSGN